MVTSDYKPEHRVHLVLGVLWQSFPLLLFPIAAIKSHNSQKAAYQRYQVVLLHPHPFSFSCSCAFSCCKGWRKKIRAQPMHPPGSQRCAVAWLSGAKPQAASPLLLRPFENELGGLHAGVLRHVCLRRARRDTALRHGRKPPSGKLPRRPLLPGSRYACTFPPGGSTRSASVAGEFARSDILALHALRWGKNCLNPHIEYLM